MAAAVAAADKPAPTIVLAFGMCSQAVLGLRTEHATLVVPKVDDCIAMFLGSNAAFEAESTKARGTYYVAKAYLDECDTIFSDHEALVEKRGLERADKMMRLLLEGYTRIVIIDMGRHDLGPLERQGHRLREAVRPCRRARAGHDPHRGRACRGRLGR